MTREVRLAPAYVQRLLNDADASTALTQLSQFWSVRARIDELGELAGLSAPERVVHLILWYLGDVGNGGHTQYLLNPGGAFVHETRDALGELGASEAAAILDNVVQRFPAGRVPKDRGARAKAVEDLDDAAMLALGEADKALWRSDLDGLALEYLRARSEGVLTPEQL